MKLLLLLGCLLTARLRAGPFDNHDDMVHDLAHYGAGTMVAEATHVFIAKSTMKPWKKVSFETLNAGIANALYEIATEKTGPTGAEHTLCGILGGAALGFAVEYRWFTFKSGKTKKKPLPQSSGASQTR